MKKIITYLVFFSMCVSLFSSVSLSAAAEKKQTEQASIMTHGKEDIVKIQYSSIRADIDKYPKSQLNDLIYHLDSVKPVDQEEIANVKRGEEYFTISFIYNDGTKDVYFFFQNNDNWYVETDKGDLYKNADFIADFTDLADFKKRTQAGEGTYELTMLPSTLKMRLELEKDFDTLGVDFEFVFYTKFFIENTGCSETEAINTAKNLLTDNMIQGECAKQLGITVSDEEMDKIVEKYVLDVSQADYFMRKYNLIYKEAGISLQESAEKNKEIMRANLIRVRLDQYMRKEFADGKDRVGDNVYENAKDYFQAYLEEVSYPQIEESVINDFSEQLDHELYYEKFA